MVYELNKMRRRKYGCCGGLAIIALWHYFAAAPTSAMLTIKATNPFHLRAPWTHSSKSQFTSSLENDSRLQSDMVHGGWTSHISKSNLLLQQRSSRDHLLFERSNDALFLKFASSIRRGSVVTMGCKDGKKQRKKKTTMSALGSPTQQQPQQQSAQSTSAPLRVSSQINIPIRHQIQIAQLNKELSSQQEGSSFRQKKVDRTSYRRTWDEDEIELKREERRRKGQDPDWSVILNRTAAAPLVMVDGYNVIFKWPRLKKHMVKGDLQRAREMLVDDLEGLRSIKGWRIEVVFDGHGRSTVGPLGLGPGNKNVVTRADKEANIDVSKHGVRVVYTGVGVEADSYIESRCAQAKNVTKGEMTGSLIVVTDDVMIRMAGQSAGALCMGAERLVEELKAVRQAMSDRIEAAVAKVNGHAIRPEKLRGTYFHSFGKRQILIEDKRNRTKIKATTGAADEDDEMNSVIDNIQVEEDENGIPWWAKVPNQSAFRKS